MAVGEPVVGAGHGGAAAAAAEGGFGLSVFCRCLAEEHPVLGPLRPGERGLDRAQVERQGVGEYRVRRAGIAPQALGACIGLDQPDLLLVTAGEA